jgi:phosphoenolpyruvate synthase/pyruvate phosphate dikinase
MVATDTIATKWIYDFSEGSRALRELLGGKGAGIAEMTRVQGLLTKAEAIATVDANSLDALLHPAFDPKAEYEVLARGVAASPGAAKGAIVFTAQEAVDAAADGTDVVLVRPFTEAEDVAGFHAAKGILTSEGGKASHAALVARGTGAITTEDVALVEGHVGQRFETVLGWCDQLATLGVRADADTPEDARRAHRFGAQGIGLCRTEHMFMAPDRQPLMRAMILAEDDGGRHAALDQLLPLQQRDFEGLFAEMAGLVVTIRLLDPPLHEFLPDRIARHADFFSFGTNDLTQTAIGFSRDDVEGRIIPRYVDERILDVSPFATIDEPGVGELVRLAVRLGRRGRADIELGICGEHGGDPASIRFFDRVGVDYVSCSPFRIPIARVAAAQAAIAARPPGADAAA